MVLFEELTFPVLFWRFPSQSLCLTFSAFICLHAICDNQKYHRINSANFLFTEVNVFHKDFIIEKHCKHLAETSNFRLK
jgi:hypothetical protein